MGRGIVARRLALLRWGVIAWIISSLPFAPRWLFPLYHGWPQGNLEWLIAQVLALTNMAMSMDLVARPTAIVLLLAPRRRTEVLARLVVVCAILGRALLLTLVLVHHPAWRQPAQPRLDQIVATLTGIYAIALVWCAEIGLCTVLVSRLPRWAVSARRALSVAACMAALCTLADVAHMQVYYGRLTGQLGTLPSWLITTFDALKPYAWAYYPVALIAILLYWRAWRQRLLCGRRRVDSKEP